MKRTNRWLTLAGAVATLVVAQAGLQLASAGPAAAVTGIEKVTSPVSSIDSQQTHTARAECPAGKSVIGGGGWAFAVAAADSAKVALVQMLPDHRAGDARDSFVVTGSETTSAMTGDWWVQAYAICAADSGLSGYEVETNHGSATSSPDGLERVAVCDSGKRAIGGGARIVNPGREVALRMARASGPGDIFRGAAHEDANGYAGDWTLDVYAVCVHAPAGYQVVTTASAQSDSESEKFALARCPSGKRVHGAGAAVSNTAPGGVSLQVVYPSSSLGQVEAFAVENTPVSQDWDLIVAQAICAY